jgi:hypothetical protein
MAMRSQSFYAAMKSYIGVTKPYVVKKPEYPAFIDGVDCVTKMDRAIQYRFRKAEQRTKKIDKIVTALLIANFLIFIAFVPEAYYPLFLAVHFIILISGFLNTTFFKKRRETKIQLAFRLTWFS